MSGSQKSSGGLKDIYLKAYNLLSTFGWIYVAVLTVQTILEWKSLNDFYTSKNLYANTGMAVRILLSTAYLEVLHAAFRLVPSNPMIVFIQVFARFVTVFGVVNVFKASHDSVGVTLMTVCWMISEIIRYAYYVHPDCSYLTWCRYTFFIVIYPIGAMGEVLCFWFAAEYLKPLSIRKMFSFFLPNKLNISFDLYYTFWIIMLIYPLAFYVMYKHMLAQRKKVLYRATKNLAKKTN